MYIYIYIHVRIYILFITNIQGTKKKELNSSYSSNPTTLILTPSAGLLKLDMTKYKGKDPAKYKVLIFLER